MDFSKAAYVRDLDSNERFIDACMISRDLCSAASISFKAKQRFTFQDLEDALIRLQKNNMQLQVTIQRSASETVGKGWNPLHWIKAPKPTPKAEFWTAPTAHIPLQWVKLGRNETWERAVIENGMQASYEEGQLLWRAFYVDQSNLESGSQEGTLILICHCAITDNRGLHLLLDNFAKEFDNVLNKVPHKPKETKMLEPLLDVLDERYKQPNSWGDSLKIGFYMASCMFMKNRSVFVSRNPIPLVPDYTTRHIVFNVSKDLSTKLLQKVKASNISLSGLITAAGMAALHEMTSTSKDEHLKFYVTHEVNVRVFCKDFEKLKGRLEGCRCTYMETSLEGRRVNKSSELWELASDAHADIVPKLSSMFQAKLCKAFCEMGGDAYQCVATGPQTIARNDFAVAVFEDLDDVFDERENIEINRVFGSVTAHSMGSPLKHVIHVFKGQIFYTMLYFGNYGKFDKAKEYGERTLAYLKMAAE